MVIILAIIITGNIFLTYERNKVWKDEFTLWGDAVQKSPQKQGPTAIWGQHFAKKVISKPEGGL